MSIYILCLPTRDEHLPKSRFYQNKNSTSKSNKNSIKTIKLIDYENEVYMKIKIIFIKHHGSTVSYMKDGIWIVFTMDGIFSKKIPYSTQFARLVIPIADSLGKISKEFKLPSLTKDVTIKNLINNYLVKSAIVTHWIRYF